MSKVIGYIFNTEAKALLDELVIMRSSLQPGEFFTEESRAKYDELNKRLNDLMGRDCEGLYEL